MSTAPRQRRTAKRSEGPFQAPAASKAAAVAHGSDTRGWSDSPRQLKQTRQIAQLKATEPAAEPAQGGLPDGLRQGIESLSGVDMSGVRVHRNSAKAAALGAHAYAQGTNIHLGPGQEKHLPHEAWHVVQQHQGRVAPTHQVAGVAVNGDSGLEREADAMGSRAMSIAQRTVRSTTEGAVQRQASRIDKSPVLQGAWHWNAVDQWWEEDEGFVYDPAKGLWHMDQADEADEEPEFDDEAIAGFKIALLSTMNTNQVLAYFGGHLADVDTMRDYLAAQVAARPGNDEIEQEDDDQELFDENDLDEGEKNAAFSMGRAVPVATTTEAGESVNSGGASTCVIVFLRAETSEERSLIGAAHLNANDLASMDTVRQSLAGLRAEVDNQLDADNGETIDSAQTYSIGGQDSDSANDLLDYVRLSLALKEFNAQMAWRGAVMPATPRGATSHVDARMDSTSVRYSVQAKAVQAPSGAVPTVQLTRDKAGLASGKADRRADRQRRDARGRQEARRQAPQAFDPGGIGHAPTGDVGVMLTMLMLLGQMHGAQAQQPRARSPQPLALPSPGHQPGARGNSTALAPQRPGQVALSQGLPRTLPAHSGMGSMGLVPFNATAPQVRRSGPTNSTALATTPQPRQPERLLIDAPLNTTSTRPLIAPPEALHNTTSAKLNTTATAKSSASQQTVPVRQPPAETSIDKSGKVTFATDALRQKYASSTSKGAIEAVAIKNLMASTATGAGILDELAPYQVDPVILRTDLGRGVGGEAALSGDKYIQVNSQQDLRRNTIVAAHEFRHREQFASGMLDKNANPYRMAYAEVEAKNVGLDTYVELKDRGYFDTDVKDADSEKLDLEERTADPQKYKRTVFNTYLSRYRGNQAAQYPDFASDAALDQHIADQEAYFAARRLVSRVEMEITKLGLNPNDTKNLPTDLKDRLLDARAESRKAKKAADKSHP